MENVTISERIATLKRIRSENNLTIQQVYDLLEASNDPLSMTTVKKIFSDGTDAGTISGRSVRQVERVLCGIYGGTEDEAADSDLIQELREQNQFMREVIVELNGQMRIMLGLMDSGADKRGAAAPVWQFEYKGARHGKED